MFIELTVAYKLERLRRFREHTILVPSPDIALFLTW